MATTGVSEHAATPQEKTPIYSSMNILTIGGFILVIGTGWRLVDQFVLGLGDTWLNIFPSKLFPFLIIIGFFWKFRPQEIATVLGMSRKSFRAHLVIGILIGLSISLLIDFGGTILYALLLDPTYPLEIHVLNPNLVGYMFIFFLTNALLEETLFRGLLQNGLKTRFSPSWAIMLSAIVFGIWHAGWPIVNGATGTAAIVQVSSMVFFTTILGLLFGIYYERFSSGLSLIGPIVVHTIINFVSECFKIGPEPAIQGPDLVFSSLGQLASTLSMFLVTFGILFLFLWRLRLEQVETFWNRVAGRRLGSGRSEFHGNTVR
ncbi:MAG: CPBP family intramembrane glutamic endopeptidase [Candidatus Thorarchaeota archaeon]|jgi:membrane protease YdiL (CAAX protease family)